MVISSSKKVWHGFPTRVRKGRRPVPPAARLHLRPTGIPSRSMCRAVALLVSIALGASAGDASPPRETIEVTLSLLTGGRVSGLVVDHTDVGIVIADRPDAEGAQGGARPLVFAWEELEPGSALLAKRELLTMLRGSREQLQAEDHYELGLFALRLDRPRAARASFAAAVRIDHAFADRTARAIDGYLARRPAAPHQSAAIEVEARDDDASEDDAERNADPTVSTDAALGGLSDDDTDPDVGARNDRRARVRAVYDEFAEKVREVMGTGIELIETDHFLIHTDWPARDRAMLPGVFESMYGALCDEFDCDPSEDIFLAKCPVFCFASKGRFWQFARTFDGFTDKEAIGYTRSIESSGHVHMALCLGGRRAGDFERFAYTLVHEGTHAFLHRFHSSRLIPHWVNEGYAELMAEQVLGDACPAGEKADLLGRQYARYGWPLGDLLRRTGPIEVHEYPLAASVVMYLHDRGRDRFAAFIRGLKDGRALPLALADHYGGITLEQLEARWRTWVLSREPTTGAAEGAWSRAVD